MLMRMAFIGVCTAHAGFAEIEIEDGADRYIATAMKA
jgi:hypothetical protein